MDSADILPAGTIGMLFTRLPQVRFPARFFAIDKTTDDNQMPAVLRAVAKATDGGVPQLGDFPSMMAENKVDFHPAEQAVVLGGWHHHEGRFKKWPRSGQEVAKKWPGSGQDYKFTVISNRKYDT